MLKYIQAEFIKLRYQPILWLIGATVVSITLLIYFAHYNDVESISQIGKDPWIKIWDGAIGIFSVFMMVPFLVLLMSATIYIEHQNNTWKYQYSAPVSRIKVLMIKLASFLMLIIIAFSLLALGIFCVAQLLNFIFPEMEFSYYSFHFSNYPNMAFFTLINSLGIIGIQFFLSIRFKGFLVPAAIGIVAFIIALIVGVTNTPASHYFPYSYTLIGQDFNMFTIDKVGVVDLGWINSVQLCSIIIFMIFTSIAIFLEHKRSV